MGKSYCVQSSALKNDVILDGECVYFSFSYAKRPDQIDKAISGSEEYISEFRLNVSINTSAGQIEYEKLKSIAAALAEKIEKDTSVNVKILFKGSDSSDYNVELYNDSVTRLQVLLLLGDSNRPLGGSSKITNDDVQGVLQLFSKLVTG